jgi:hypothetical protein
MSRKGGAGLRIGEFMWTAVAAPHFRAPLL